METTITLECTLDKREHLRDLEHQLKQIHGLKVFFVEPRDEGAPVLISIGVPHKQADLAIKRIAHTLYDYLHSSTEQPGQRKVTLVTIEGTSIELATLESDEIEQIIAEAHAGQSA